MDATQKRRLWKVAFGYFVLTMLVATQLPIFYAGPYKFDFSPDYIEVAWRTFCAKFFLILQPQILLLYAVAQIEALKGLSKLPFWWGMLINLISILLWSSCFGWLYTKAVDWLNHFPALGRKVI
jgi:hypothetical protein